MAAGLPAFHLVVAIQTPAGRDDQPETGPADARITIAPASSVLRIFRIRLRPTPCSTY